jgi:molybdenum cofactor guanylyltransferase
LRAERVGALRDASVAGFVLAGGASSRMGKDKALVELDGRQLIVHALEILREAGVPASIAGARSDLAAFGPVIEDTAPGSGPLAGVCAALASTSTERAVFLSVDLPLVPASSIAALLDHAQLAGSAVTLASVNGFAQTFPAVIDPALLPALQAELEAGRTGCFSAFVSAAASAGRRADALPAEMLAQCGQAFDARALPPALWFLNVNTQADLDRAERALRRAARVS